MMQRLAEQKQQRIISARGTFNHPLYQIKPKNVMLDTEMIKLSPSNFEKKRGMTSQERKMIEIERERSRKRKGDSQQEKGRDGGSGDECPQIK